MPIDGAAYTVPPPLSLSVSAADRSWASCLCDSDAPAPVKYRSHRRLDARQYNDRIRQSQTLNDSAVQLLFCAVQSVEWGPLFESRKRQPVGITSGADLGAAEFAGEPAGGRRRNDHRKKAARTGIAQSTVRYCARTLSFLFSLISPCAPRYKRL